MRSVGNKESTAESCHRSPFPFRITPTITATPIPVPDGRKLFPHVKAFVEFLVSLDATGIEPGIKNFICVERLGARPRGRRQCGVGTKRNVGLSESPRRIGDGPGQIQTAAVALRRERSIRGNLADTNRGCSALRERGHLAGVSGQRR